MKKIGELVLYIGFALKLSHVDLPKNEKYFNSFNEIAKVDKNCSIHGHLTSKTIEIPLGRV